MYSRPGPDDYSDVFEVGAGQSISPLALPDVVLDPAGLQEVAPQ